MKIFNQSARVYSIGRINLQPGKFTDIPEDLHETAEKVLAKWGHELVTAESTSAGNLASRVRELTETCESQKKQIEKLQAVLITEENAVAKELATVKDALAIAQKDLRTTTDSVQLLQSQAALKDAQIAGMTSDIEQLTRPKKK